MLSFLEVIEGLTTKNDYLLVVQSDDEDRLMNQKAQSMITNWKV